MATFLRIINVLIINQGAWYNAPAGLRQTHVQEAALLRKGFHEGIAVP